MLYKIKKEIFFLEIERLWPLPNVLFLFEICNFFFKLWTFLYVIIQICIFPHLIFSIILLRSHYLICTGLMCNTAYFPMQKLGIIFITEIPRYDSGKWANHNFLGRMDSLGRN